MKSRSEFFDVMILMAFAISAGLLATGIILIVSWVMQQPQMSSNLALPQPANVIFSGT